MTGGLQPAVQTCRACQRPFTVTAGEIARLRSLSQREGGLWALPARCPACRQAIRDARPDDVITDDTPREWYTLQCLDCHTDFSFGPRNVAYHAAHGYRWPRRCKPCRAAQRQWREGNTIASGVREG